jgi:hypothetical protein
MTTNYSPSMRTFAKSILMMTEVIVRNSGRKTNKEQKGRAWWGVAQKDHPHRTG